MVLPALALVLLLAGDPAPPKPRTPEEVAAEVHRLLDNGYRSRCSTGYAEDIAKLGHDAVAPLLEGLRKLKEDHPGDSLSCGALTLLAVKEDVPAIRELLLAGRTNVARALERLQEKGVTEATDALLDAVAAGRIDSDVLEALEKAADRARVVKAVRTWVDGKEEVGEGDRIDVARFFAACEVRDAAPTLRSWAATSKKPRTICAVAYALVALGEKDGVALLVTIASERVTRFPCRASTPEEEAAAAAPGRRCPEGFDDSDRERALNILEKISGGGIHHFDDSWRRDLPRDENVNDVLDRVAALYRTWWDGAKDRLRYDPEKKAWVVG